MCEYDDIINMKRPISKRTKMPISKRAAIFNPFDALTGYSDDIIEINRYVEKKLELTPDLEDDLNNMIEYILANKDDIYNISYFVKDDLKEGGVYKNTSGSITKINLNDRFLIIDNTKISFEDLYQIKLI